MRALHIVGIHTFKVARVRLLGYQTLLSLTVLGTTCRPLHISGANAFMVDVLLRSCDLFFSLSLFSFLA
jgi:hypothetical protein